MCRERERKWEGFRNQEGRRGWEEDGTLREGKERKHAIHEGKSRLEQRGRAGRLEQLYGGEAGCDKEEKEGKNVV